MYTVTCFFHHLLLSILFLVVWTVQKLQVYGYMNTEPNNFLNTLNKFNMFTLNLFELWSRATFSKLKPTIILSNRRILHFWVWTVPCCMVFSMYFYLRLNAHKNVQWIIKQNYNSFIKIAGKLFVRFSFTINYRYWHVKHFLKILWKQEI